MGADMENDDYIERLSHEVDHFIEEVCDVTGVSVPELSAIMLARLGLINREIGTTDNLLEFLKDVCDVIKNPKYADANPNIH